MRRATGVVAACVLLCVAVAVQAAPIQWTLAEGGNGHSYEAVYNAAGWASINDARSAAAARGGYLATVTSAAEHQWLLSQNLYGPYPEYGYGDWVWLGGYQDRSDPTYAEPSGGWKWGTGEDWSFTSWGGTEPNNYLNIEDYLVALPGGQWFDYWGGGTYGIKAMLVEYDAVPEPSGLLALAGSLGCAVPFIRRRR